jgi:hypothetical protein
VLLLLLVQDDLKTGPGRPDGKAGGGGGGGPSVFVGGDYIRQQKEFLTKLQMVGPTQGESGSQAEVKWVTLHGTALFVGSTGSSANATCLCWSLCYSDLPKDQAGIMRPWAMPGPGKGRPAVPTPGPAVAGGTPVGLPPRPHTAQPWPAGQHTPDMHSAGGLRGLASGGGGGGVRRAPGGGGQVDPRATELTDPDLGGQVCMGGGASSPLCTPGGDHHHIPCPAMQCWC